MTTKAQAATEIAEIRNHVAALWVVAGDNQAPALQAELEEILRRLEALRQGLGSGT